MDRRTEGQTDRRTDRQMDRRTDGQTDQLDKRDKSQFGSGAIWGNLVLFVAVWSSHLKPSACIWYHLEASCGTQEAPRHPRGTQETPRWHHLEATFQNTSLPIERNARVPSQFQLYEEDLMVPSIMHAFLQQHMIRSKMSVLNLVSWVL